MSQRPPPHAEPPLARIAAAVADASRSRMLSHLLGGEYASAGELAAAASVGPATASAHLARLLDAGLVACEPRGRHRYYRLADGEVAHALEALALVADRSSHERTWTQPARDGLRLARCCYGHIAGVLGVALLAGLHEQGWLVPSGADGRRRREHRLTESGAAALTAMGLDGARWHRRCEAAAAPGGPARGRVAYGCLDWSERRDHLAGPLAVAMAQHFAERGWIVRRGSDRALTWTPTGRRALHWIHAPPADW